MSVNDGALLVYSQEKTAPAVPMIRVVESSALVIRSFLRTTLYNVFSKT
jgi:hypothetical protein